MDSFLGLWLLVRCVFALSSTREPCPPRVTPSTTCCMVSGGLRVSVKYRKITRNQGRERERGRGQGLVLGGSKVLADAVHPPCLSLQSLFFIKQSHVV